MGKVRFYYDRSFPCNTSLQGFYCMFFFICLFCKSCNRLFMIYVDHFIQCTYVIWKENLEYNFRSFFPQISRNVDWSHLKMHQVSRNSGPFGSSVSQGFIAMFLDVCSRPPSDATFAMFVFIFNAFVFLGSPTRWHRPTFTLEPFVRSVSWLVLVDRSVCSRYWECAALNKRPMSRPMCRVSVRTSLKLCKK